MNKNPKPEKSKTEISGVLIDTIKFNGDFTVDITYSLKSNLIEKIERLSGLENNYQILESRNLEVEKSIVCNGISKLKNLNSEKLFFEIKNLGKFKSGIREINYAFVKGSKDLGGNTYARAKIEEVIFSSKNSAQNLTNLVKLIKKKGIIWEDIDKSPSAIFNEENKLYYISTGGWYMKPFYNEIEETIKN